MKKACISILSFLIVISMLFSGSTVAFAQGDGLIRSAWSKTVSIKAG